MGFNSKRDDDTHSTTRKNKSKTYQLNYLITKTNLKQKKRKEEDEEEEKTIPFLE